MSCNIEEVLKKTTNKLATAEKGTEKYSTLQALVNKLKMVASVVSNVVAMPKVVDSLKNGKLIIGSRQPIIKTRLTVAEEIKEFTSSPNKSPYAQYSSAVSQAILDIAKPLVKKDFTSLMQVLLGRADKYAAGLYDAKTNVIYTISDATYDDYVKMADTAIEEQYAKIKDPEGVMDEGEVFAGMLEDSEYKRLQRAKPDVIKEIQKIVEAQVNTNGVHVMTHELIHAGSIRYMRENPTSAATKRIEKLFELAKSPRNAAKIKSYLTSYNEENNDYWTTNAEEFIAEALSNPAMMLALNSIEVTGIGSKLTTLLKDLYSTLLRALGFTQSTSLYAYTLDGLTAMLEQAQRDLDNVEVFVIGEMSPKVKATLDEVFRKIERNTLSSEATVGDTKLHKEYSKLFKDTADRFLKYTVEITDEVLLDNLRNDINKIVPGDYEPDTNNIRIVSEAVNELELNMAAAVGVDTAAVKELYRLADELPTIQDKTKFVEDATQQQAYKEATSRTVDAKITELSDVLGELDRDKVLVHELVHVAAVKFMTTEQTGKKEKAVQDRINTLFADAKKRYLAMGHTAEDMAAEYWAKNVNEFLAEAISNPKTIALLESMKTGKMGRLSTVLRMLVDALAALVSTSKNKDNVYYYILDGVLAIVENSKANNTAKTQNTATQPLDKLSQNMLVLNNSKAEEVEEALACKNKGK